MKHRVHISAEMDGVGEIGPKDQVFLLVKRIASDGSTMSREQYPAYSVIQFDENGVASDLGELISEADLQEQIKKDDYARRLADAPDIVIDYED